jgi:hypothetical protein
MRKITLMLLLVIAGSAMTTVSCKKKNDDTPPPPTGVFTETFSAKIDGVNFTATAITATNNGGALIVNGVSGNKTLSIQFATTLAVGSHTLPGAMYDENGTLYGMTDGTIVITGNDANLHRVTGTFTMNVSDFNVTTKAITNGTFSVEYE